MHHITSFVPMCVSPLSTKPASVSPLLIAVRSGDLSKVITLLRTIALHDLSKQESYTVLQAAVIGLHAEIVQRLLVSSSIFRVFKNPSMPSMTGYHSPIVACVGYANSNSDLFARSACIWAAMGERKSLLHDAVGAGSYDVLRLLLIHKADVNAVTASGTTALMQAVKEQRHDMVQLLLESKANIDQNNRHQSALTLVEATDWQSDTRLINLLLSYGANFDENSLPRLDSKTYVKKMRAYYLVCTSFCGQVKIPFLSINFYAACSTLRTFKACCGMQSDRSANNFFRHYQAFFPLSATAPCVNHDRCQCFYVLWLLQRIQSQSRLVFPQAILVMRYLGAYTIDPERASKISLYSQP